MFETLAKQLIAAAYIAVIFYGTWNVVKYK